MNLDMILKDDDLYYQWVDYIEDYDTDNINDCYISIYDDYYNAEMFKFFLLCDLSGIEVRCRMLRQGKFTDDEWALINQHCKMIE